MTADILIRRAAPADLDRSLSLLREFRLPPDGLSERFADALVASRGSEIVGCIALEVYEGSALLRSLVVAENTRGMGVGERLTTGALGLAKARGVIDVYLLTETAQSFFPRFGFRIEDRSAAPAAIRESVEFRSACPKSAVMMHLGLGS